MLGVLAGADMPILQLRFWADSAQVLLAADGGADRLRACGRVPEATIGDLDSITPEAAASQIELIGIDDQNSSDCDKLLALAVSRGHRAITLVGVEGDLPDHVIGTIQSAARAKIAVRFGFRKGMGEIVSGPSSTEYKAEPGTRFSVIPIVSCKGVTLTGTQWELKNDALDPLGLTSLSNRTVMERVFLAVTTGAVFVFLETDGSPVWG